MPIYSNMYHYIITDGDYLKIGVTSDLQKRLYNLQTGNSGKLSIVGFIIATREQCYHLDNALKCLFHRYKHMNEWYDITFKMCKKVMKIAGYKYEVPEKFLVEKDMSITALNAVFGRINI